MPRKPAGKLTLFHGASAFPFEPREAVKALCDADRELAAVIERIGPFAMQLESTTSVFGALAQAIAYQQLTGKAAATIYGRVRTLCGGRGGVTAEQIAALRYEDLRAAGLSNAKTLSMKDLARRTIDGELPTLAQARKLDEETLIEQLTKVRGVGRWTVEMFLMFRLGRPDVLPLGDYGIRKGFQVAFKKRTLPSPKQVAVRGERWKPYRTAASWYLWRAAEAAKRKDDQ